MDLSEKCQRKLSGDMRQEACVSELSEGGKRLTSANPLHVAAMFGDAAPGDRIERVSVFASPVQAGSVDADQDDVSPS
jgi:hypothetical protein